MLISNEMRFDVCVRARQTTFIYRIMRQVLRIFNGIQKVSSSHY